MGAAAVFYSSLHKSSRFETVVVMGDVLCLSAWSTPALVVCQIRFLRTMLEWRYEVTSDGPGETTPQPADGTARIRDAVSGSQQEGEVMILIWPAGDFVRLPRGTTAGQIVHDQVRWLYMLIWCSVALLT